MSKPARKPTNRKPTSRKQPASRSPAGGGDPTEEQIRKRAYEYYLGRGGAYGDSIDDWLRAERELRAKPPE